MDTPYLDIFSGNLVPGAVWEIATLV